MRWHALIGVPLFLLLPYVSAFMVYYPVTGNLEKAIKYGMPVPFLYSLLLIWIILLAIRRMLREEKQDGAYNTKVEIMVVYFAVAPWILMSVFSWFHVAQWIEVLVTNLGFLMVTIVFIYRSIRANKADRKRRLELEINMSFSEAFEQNILLYNFTERELEVVKLIRQGYSRAEIADMLCISLGTLGEHVQFIHEKAVDSTRQQLMAKMEMP